MKITVKNIVVAAGLVAAGLFIGWILFGGNNQASEGDHQHETMAEEWTCSMHPQVRQDGPGQCPLCGMDLIPLSSMQEETGVMEVQMTEAAMKIADVRTVTVGKGMSDREIYLQGKVAVNEKNLAKVPAHFSGRVERLFADFTGQYIQKGQRLATLYSPDLVMAQKELFEAAKYKDQNPEYYEAAVRKLKLWELTDNQVKDILEKGEPQYEFDIYSPRSGTITARNVTEGQHVQTGEILVEVSNLNSLWVNFDVYESDLQWVEKGQQVEFTVSSFPGRKYTGKVSFIDPTIDRATRAAKIRVEIENKNGELKPEMFAEGRLNSGSGDSDQLFIPKSAVLWTGKRAVVYVKQNNYSSPTFKFTEVILGPESGDYYVVVEGLDEGDEIVANGIFKVDAAAQLQGKTSMMNPEGGSTGTGHDHFKGEQLGINPPESDITDLKVHEMGENLESTEQFKSQLTEVFQAYIPLKESFVASDRDQAAGNAQKLVNALDKVDMSQVKGDAHDIWMKDLAVLKNASLGIVQSSDIEEARKPFSPLSDQLYHTLKKFQVASGGFRQYCPMAFNNEGAFWLSDSDEVLNPYFGDAMLRCGSVEEKLLSNK